MMCKTENYRQYGIAYEYGLGIPKRVRVIANKQPDSVFNAKPKTSAGKTGKLAQEIGVQLFPMIMKKTSQRSRIRTRVRKTQKNERIIT